jgi:zinc transport system permease protein
MWEALRYDFMQNALIAGVLAAVACGVMGTYVVVKRIVFISGGISHTAYGGVGLGYLVGISPLLGATGFSLLAALSIGWAVLRLRQQADTVIGIIWAVGMALGIIFVSLAPGATPDLMTYLFGNVLMVSSADLWLMTGLVGGIALVIVAFYKELLTVAYDEEYALVLGLPVQFIYLLLLSAVALTVIILMRVVGIIMVIALLTIPAATARLYVDRLGQMMAVSVLIGVVCTTCGLALSYALNSLFSKPFPSGPVIILLAALIYVLSLPAAHFTRR